LEISGQNIWLKNSESAAVSEGIKRVQYLQITLIASQDCNIFLLLLKLEKIKF